MSVKYLQIPTGSQLPDISGFQPFRAVVIIENDSTPAWQSMASTWLVKSGCLYMMAWGNNCSSWDDSVDYANLAEFNYGDIPEDQFVMTTWHEDESLDEVFWFAKNNAFHPSVELRNTVILHISGQDREKELLSQYADA